MIIMIKDSKKVASIVSDWMEEYANSAKATSLVLGLSGGIDSALCALLAKNTSLKLVCVNMPCHSSSSAFDRAAAFAKEIGVELHHVDLSKAHSEVIYQLPQAFQTRGSMGALRSCLRSPTLSFIAHASNGLIVGTGNRSEDHITRYYQKFGDGCVDFCPIADLWKSEVRTLFKYLAEEMNGGTMGPAAQAIYDAKPTADLWGPDAGQEDESELGISYDEIEWADKEDRNNNIIFSSLDPFIHEDWETYTDRQKVVIEKLHHLEKVSRHKHNPYLPICCLRPLSGYSKDYIED
jgi:NAD+ synthase